MTEIVRTPDTCFGRARIDGHRLPVWLFESWRRGGATDDQLLDWYPQLVKEDLQAVWAYADANKPEIDLDIAAQSDDGTLFGSSRDRIVKECHPTFWRKVVANTRPLLFLLGDVWSSVKRFVVDAFHRL
jgi:uncharacterized protein (DUF433 family)